MIEFKAVYLYFQIVLKDVVFLLLSPLYEMINVGHWQEPQSK